MKLSEIVDQRKKLQDIKKNFADISGQQHRRSWFDHNQNTATFFPQFNQRYLDLDQDFIDTVDHQIQKLNQLWATQHQQYLLDSQHFFNKILNENFNHVTNTMWRLSARTHDVIVNKLKSHSNWTYPGLIFRPSALQDLRAMVSCNPLYLVDQDRELLDQSLKEFPDAYQQRLRPYVIDHHKKNFLHPLPIGNLGFVVALYYFNFKDIDTINNYLKQIFQLLKPGGICSFSFNDCDHSHEINQAERHVNSYVPGHMLCDMIKKLGYHVIFQSRDITGISWWEIQKPGEITSLRGGQTLAKIIAKSK